MKVRDALKATTEKGDGGNPRAEQYWDGGTFG
jgi:hypothetical protein